MTDTPPPNQPIHTKRLILREARKFDITAFHKLYSSKEVMRYWAPPHGSLSRTESYLEAMVASPTNGELGFVIVLPPSASMTTSSTLPVITTMDEGIVIGHAGIWYADRNELVFMIGREYWRQGYMTEVLAALVPIFWQKGLKKIYADVNAANVGSMKVLMNCGFLPMGENIVEVTVGKWHSLRMGLTEPDREGDDEGEEEEDIEFADENSSGDMIGDKDA